MHPFQLTDKLLDLPAALPFYPSRTPRSYELNNHAINSQHRERASCRLDGFYLSACRFFVS
jgi:hypothetical protein